MSKNNLQLFCERLLTSKHYNNHIFISVAHKISWVDQIIREIREWKKEFTSSPLQQPEEVPRLIFVSHSFGAYLVQHLLLRRPDILKRTQQIIHLMPFIRFDPHPLQKIVLSTLAHSYRHTIPALINCVRGLTFMFPKKFIDIFLNKVVGLDCDEGRKITLEVCTHPRMVRNHLVLGFEEIREIPELPNVSSCMSKTCIISFIPIQKVSKLLYLHIKRILRFG